MRARWALLASVLLAGCAAPTEPSSGPGPPPGEEGPPRPSWALPACASTLHVWLVPLEELRQRTPPEFPPAVLREQGLLDTPLGRIVFYLYDCARTERDGVDQGRSLLGLLGVRVVPPEEVAPPSEQPDWASTPWVSVYLLHAVAAGPVRGVLAAAGHAFEEVEGDVVVEPGALPDAPAARATLRAGGATVFEGAMQGAGGVEAFNRPERYYALEGRDVRWLDVSFNMTLWETEGTVDYAAGSAWDAAVGNRAYDAAVDHHAMEADLGLAWGRGALGPAPQGRSGP